MRKRTLPQQTKDIFALIAKAAFANPFGKKRVELDRQILEMTLEKPADKTHQKQGNPSSKNTKEQRDSDTAQPDATVGEFAYGDLSALSWAAIVPLAVKQVRNQIDSLDKECFAKLDDFREEDSDLLRWVFLFDVFHKYIKQFDKLIIDQKQAGTETLQVDFAEDAIFMMTERGFSASKAKRYFALFFQMRRAFYFIHNSLVGNCESMRKLRMNLWNNIFTHDIVFYEQYLWDKMEDFSTLLLGPTGAGKGAAAAAIGMSGFIPFNMKTKKFEGNFTENFISINLSQFPENLIESELFGHKKGAFTGALEGHLGIFSMCSRHGTIFIDEIGDVSISVQIKLLKVLQERQFSPVGSHQKIKFHGRVIAATNKSLDKLRAAGKFRDDFYYRLCSDCIEVPSLQKRIAENPAELDELIGVCVERIAGARSKKIMSEVKDVITNKLGKIYHWPGNVRELAQCVRRVIVKQDYEGDNAALMSKEAGNGFTKQIEAGAVTGKDVLAWYCYLLYQKFGTYEQVAKTADLDRRTVKKYILQFEQQQE